MTKQNEGMDYMWVVIPALVFALMLFIFPDDMMWVVVLGLVVIIAIILLNGFDKIAGRGPKQVSDGIDRARGSEGRIPCPMCAEKILPQAKVCPFCKSPVNK